MTYEKRTGRVNNQLTLLSFKLTWSNHFPIRQAQRPEQLFLKRLASLVEQKCHWEPHKTSHLRPPQLCPSTWNKNHNFLSVENALTTHNSIRLSAARPLITTFKCIPTWPILTKLASELRRGENQLPLTSFCQNVKPIFLGFTPRPLAANWVKMIEIAQKSVGVILGLK